IDFILARAEDNSGFLAAGAAAVNRLRKAVDRACGSGVASAIIATGSGQEYRLGIPRELLRYRVYITDCFFELVGRNVITEKAAEKMRKHFDILPRPVHPDVAKALERLKLQRKQGVNDA